MIQYFLKLISPFLNKIWRYRLTIGIILFVLYAWFIAKPDPPISSGEKALRETLRIEKAKNGNQIAVLEQRLIYKAGLNDALEKERDSIANLLKVKPKWIKGMTSVTTKIDTFFVEKVVSLMPPEGMGGNEEVVLSSEHHDPWIDITAKLSPSVGLLTVKVRDTPFVVFTERRPLFKKAVFETRVYNSSPYIQQGTGYSYTEKPKKLWLVGGLGAGYDPFTRKVTFNFGAYIPVIKLYR